MPSRTIIRRLFVVILIAIGMVATVQAFAAPEKPKTWQVNVTFPGLPAEANPSEPEGRVEVYVNGRWLFCVAVPRHQPVVNEVTLGAFELSFVFEGARDDFHVEAFDELRRLGGMTVAVKPAPLPPIQVIGPR